MIYPGQPTTHNSQLTTLHIGAGKRKIAGAVTLDINPRVNPDVLWDLNVFPYPFEDCTFDRVVCEHVIEHLREVISVMEELHRVCKPRGRVYVTVPHFSSLNFNTDPTHVHAFSSRSFDYICMGTNLVEYDYSTRHFRKLSAHMTMHPLTPLNRLLMRLINANLLFYEEHLAYMIPGQELRFVLEVVK
jgi:SAM-dependent methyltransferase